MPSYVNTAYVQRKLKHIDEQIEALKRRKTAIPLGDATTQVASIAFQKQRREVLIWATKASNTEITEAKARLSRLAQPATAALMVRGDLSGVQFEAVQARAYWELITCAVTSPETSVTL